MKNWKTTASAVIAAAAGFIVIHPEWFVHYPWIVDISKYVMSGGLLSLGLTCKDFNAHSTLDEVVQADIEQAKNLSVPTKP